MPSQAQLAAALADRYRIERELGRGGFAVVYLAHDLRHDRPVALKVLHDEVAASLGAERFEQEVRLAARLQHPHILGVFDSGSVDGRLWFTMPFIDGESLRDRLTREKQLPVADAIALTREIADGLHFAHQQGVIHRDVKPENILLSGRHAIIADFGIARALAGKAGSLTQTGVSVGTPGYMSPEQASGERDLDARTDVYALACVLYEMLAGQPPFTGPNAQAVIARTLSEEPRPIHAVRQGVSPMLDGVIGRGLAKVPADRWATAEEFGNALAAATVTVASAAFAPAAAAADAAAPRRRRSPMLTVFALGLLLGGGALFAWRSRHGDAAGHGLAVLPFENVGAAEDAYFADGITEEVRGKLTAVPGLRVTARTSSNQYKGTKKSLVDIGGELGVEYILTGTIRWETAADGTRHVRVTPELVSVSNGSTKWQQPFDEVMSDVFKVQSGIAEQVANALGVTLAAEVQQKLNARPTKNIDAYQEYLLGEKETEGMARSDGLSLQKGLPHYERAAALDTAFAAAWGRVSYVYSQNFNANPSSELAEKSEDAVMRAMRLAPDDPQVRRAYSRYLRIVKHDFAGALAQVDTALLRDPNNVDLLSASSSLNAVMSRWDAAVSAAMRASTLDPRNPNAVSATSRILHGVRRYAEADAYAAKALALSPGNISYAEDRVINHVSMGDLAAAKADVREAFAKGADTTELAAYFALFQEMQWVLDEPLLRRIVTMTPAQFRNNRAHWALKVGRTWLLLGDTARGRAYGDSARIVVEAQLANYPEDAQLHELRGRSLALMGRNADAIAEAERSLKMRETALDASTGPYVRYQVARILVQAGANERALDIIEPLLTANYADITPAWLRLEPVFSPLRSNPRFQRLTAR
ncbi:MAG: protein kinase [Gemmatimonadetes bacterium]|nr:protein kinase [Gemmatimonadota bacterium]